MIMEKDQFFDVGKIDEVSVGKMKYVEVSMLCMKSMDRNLHKLFLYNAYGLRLV